ncbi:MAG TPA: hypothetical protein VND92_03875 [Vicinamibacterales bacterium]|nr:hypothetical protein [Vicinamibacterales bacterium]
MPSRRIAILVLAAVTFGAAQVGLRADEIIDRVLAVVSGEVITLSDARAARTFGLVDLPPGVDALNAVLQKLIDRDLMLGEVEHYSPPEPDPAAIDRRLEAIRRRFPTQAAYEQALLTAGFDQSHLRAVVRDNLRIQAYLDQRFPAPPAPADEEIEQYYRTHPALFTRDGVLQPLAHVRTAVVSRMTAEQRNALVAEWLAGLRLRGNVTILYLGGSTPPSPR